MNAEHASDRQTIKTGATEIATERATETRDKAKRQETAEVATKLTPHDQFLGRKKCIFCDQK